MTVQAQRTTGRKEHLSAAEYNARRAAIENGAVNKQPIVHNKLTNASRKAKTPVHTEQEYNKNNLPNMGFVETNASYEIGGVQYLPSEVFNRKHSVYDAIVTGIGRTDLPRDVFARAKPRMVVVAMDAIADTLEKHKRYPSFMTECYQSFVTIQKAHKEAVTAALEANNADIDIESFKEVFVGNALRNEIQVAVVTSAIKLFGGSIRNLKLG